MSERLFPFKNTVDDSVKTVAKHFYSKYIIPRKAARFFEKGATVRQVATLFNVSQTQAKKWQPE